MKKKIRVLFVLLIFVFNSTFVGCKSVEEMKIKFGMRNKDFEYMKQGKVSKVVIQNIRDKGFTFIVTDKNSIEDLYKIVSSGKAVDKNTSLEPDYNIEFYEGIDKVHRFKYIAGLDKSDAGNFYGDNKVYIVSKRLDDDIINNFSSLRIPREFQSVYYTSIIKAIDDYNKTFSNNEKIGLDMNDEEAAKFILTMDMEEFKEKLPKNSEIVKNDDRDKYNVTMDIITEGYTKDIYKCEFTFLNKKTKKETKYYFINKYEFNSWNFNMTRDEKPKEF